MGQYESATVGQLKADGLSVRWICQQCGATGLADVDRIIAARGADFCLTDRTAPCPAPGCGYWVGFYAQGRMAPSALTTPAGGVRDMRRRTAWLVAAWTAGGNEKSPRRANRRGLRRL